MGCLQHYGAVSKLLDEAVFALDGYTRVSTSSRIWLEDIFDDLLAYEISATLSLLKQFLFYGEFLGFPMLFANG
jgi:hypothetical protein